MPWLEWYNNLVKPDWTPAPSTIGLIWQILYPIIVITFGFVFVQAFRGKIPWWVIASGAGHSTKGNISLNGTVGQWATGGGGNEMVSLEAGFFSCATDCAVEQPENNLHPLFLPIISGGSH